MIFPKNIVYLKAKKFVSMSIENMSALHTDVTNNQPTAISVLRIFSFFQHIKTSKL